MLKKKRSGNKRNNQSNFAKLSVFQPNKYKFKKSCPLSAKGAPEIDYKNIKLFGNSLKLSLTKVKLLFIRNFTIKMLKKNN
mgnify:CR=1 FL=1